MVSLVLLAGLASAKSTARPRPGEPGAPVITQVGTVTHPPVTEQSGCVASRTYPGVVWVHNDSGDQARVFAIEVSNDDVGAVIKPPWLEGSWVGTPVAGEEPYPGIAVEMATNIDWEDITLVGDDLWIADVGNNGNARRDLGFYVVAEPNPRATHRVRAQRHIAVHYPDQTSFPAPIWHYDAEGVFTYEGKVYVITKHRAPYQIGTPEPSADLWRLDTTASDVSNALVKVDTRDGLGGWVTGADYSTEAEKLAVLVTGPKPALLLFDRPAQGDAFLSGQPVTVPLPHAKQAEAVCFVDARTLLVTNEQREVFRIVLGDS